MMLRERSMTQQSGDEMSRPPPSCPAEIEVHVHMFGMVSAMTGEREVTLHLPHDAVVNDLIGALAERYKTPLFEDAMAMAGKKTSHCRISVNGHLVREPTAPLKAEGGRSSVEIILLSAFEGG
jgi:hypothetical protein